MDITNVAFVMISTGPFARTCKAEVCLESMYKVGKYEGKAFLITDSPECYDQADMDRHAGDRERIQIIPVKKFSHKLDLPVTVSFTKGKKFNYPRWRVITPRKRFRSKALKAEVFKLIDDPSIKVLIYIDADVVFMRNKGMEDLLADAISNWDREKIKIRVRRWDNDQHIFNENCHIHGGFFIVHRQYSQKALAGWGKMMAQEDYWIENVTDKDKFMRAWKEANAADGPNYMSIDPIKDGYEAIFDPDSENGLIGHITHGRVKKLGKKVIEAFISQFQLTSYPKGYYTLPGFPNWIFDLFFLGYLPSFGTFKIEKVWKQIRSTFVYDR